MTQWAEFVDSCPPSDDAEEWVVTHKLHAPLTNELFNPIPQHSRCALYTTEIIDEPDNAVDGQDEVHAIDWRRVFLSGGGDGGAILFNHLNYSFCFTSRVVLHVKVHCQTVL